MYLAFLIVFISIEKFVKTPEDIFQDFLTLQQRIKITELKTSLETLNERKNDQELSNNKLLNNLCMISWKSNCSILLFVNFLLSSHKYTIHLRQ